MAGLLSRWDRYYLKSYESMAGHRFNFTTFATEPNVLGANWGTTEAIEQNQVRRRLCGSLIVGKLGFATFRIWQEERRLLNSLHVQYLEISTGVRMQKRSPKCDVPGYTEYCQQRADGFKNLYPSCGIDACDLRDAFLEQIVENCN